MTPIEALAMLRVVTRITALALRALEAGQDISHRELADAFDDADAAENEWADANRGGSPDG